MAELMKGHVWHERCDAVNRKGIPVVRYPVLVEDKHDEIRCHVKIQKFFDAGHDYWDTSKPPVYLSYAGKPLANMGRFDEMFLKLHAECGYGEFDLGFEVNGNFNDSYRWVRSTRGVPDDLRNATFKFYVFGLPAEGGTMLRQQYLRTRLAMQAGCFAAPASVCVPRVVVANSAAEVEQAFLDARARGLEGVMVKQQYAMYERKRTDGWLKMKPEDDADGVIVELIEATATVDDPERGVRVGDRLGRVGSVRMRMQDGSEACPHGIGHELGRDMQAHPEKYLGEWAEMKYMMRDRQGGYRHCTFKRLREAK